MEYEEWINEVIKLWNEDVIPAMKTRDAKYNNQRDADGVRRKEDLVIPVTDWCDWYTLHGKGLTPKMAVLRNLADQAGREYHIIAAKWGMTVAG